MPSRNRVKIYVKDGYYHIYNRGVAKQNIFNDKQDYKVFLSYLKTALTKPIETKVDFSLRGRSFQAVPRPLKNFEGEISLIAFCLMPNHFHLLVKQNSDRSMEKFMRSVITRYAQYFNKKYERIGPLFQGRYKAVVITNDRYLLHLSRYIHLNISKIKPDLTKGYSSYSDYIGLTKTGWVNPNIILKFFSNRVIPELIKINNYKNFVEKYKTNSSKVLGELTLE